MSRLLGLLFAGLCLCASIQAEEVTDLYRASVDVADQSNAERQRGIREALAEVLVKVTGDSHVVQLEGIGPVLDNADEYVASIGYSSLPPDEKRAEPGTALDVSFAADTVEQLVRRSGVTILPSNRPRLLLWLVVDDITQGRQFLSAARESDELRQFTAVLDRRGIPYQLPTLDLEDQLGLSADDVWYLDAEKIDAASQRYAADGWIALRFFQTSSGEIRGAWRYHVADFSGLNDTTSQNEAEFARQATDEMVDSIAAHFAYVPQQNLSEILVQIDGVDSYSSYKGVVESIRKLELVRSFSLLQVNKTTLLFNIDVDGDVAKLYQALTRNPRLQKLNGNPDIYTVKLHFNWKPG